jgi:ABC-2 type transport system permease protein
MKPFLALLMKEEKAFFTSTTAYAVITVFMVIMGYTFTLTLFVSHAATLVHLFFQMFALLLLTIPVITMRAVAEERRLRTLEMVLTAPVTEVQLIVAKYLACLSLVAVMLILSAVYPATLALFGEPDWGPIYSGYLGLLLLGAALVALGLMTSSLAGSQVIAALLSLSLFLVLWIIDEFGRLLPDPFDALVVNMSLSIHFKPFATGSLFLSDAGYFVTLALLALVLGLRGLARR